MDKRRILIIVVAVAMALLAIVLMNNYLKQRETELVERIPKAERVQVLVATRDIPRGTIVDKSMIAFGVMPVNFVQPGALNSADTALGKIVIADILKDEQITASKLSLPQRAQRDTFASLSAKTPSGKRAVTIPMDAMAAVGGAVKPGDYVDIVGTFLIPQQIEGKQVNQPVTVTLFQNVLVLSLGSGTQEVEQEEASDRRSRTQRTTRSTSSFNTITFALTPKETGLLIFAQQNGELKLVLRSSLETAVEPIPVATWDTLIQHILSTQGPSAFVEQPMEVPGEVTPKPSVEIYRAGQKEEKTLE